MISGLFVTQMCFGVAAFFEANLAIHTPWPLMPLAYCVSESLATWNATTTLHVARLFFFFGGGFGTPSAALSLEPLASKMQKFFFVLL